MGRELNRDCFFACFHEGPSLKQLLLPFQAVAGKAGWPIEPVFLGAWGTERGYYLGEIALHAFIKETLNK